MSDLSVVVKDLYYSFGRGKEVLSGVNFTIERGGITALLGLNGAGKTTLLRAIMGLIRPRAGTIEVLGNRLGPRPPAPELLARIGYVPERPFTAERMTPRDLLRLVRALHPRWDGAMVGRYLRIFNIPLDRSVQELSAGTKAQLGLTLAMAGHPELLLLDEPTLGLDPLHRYQYFQLLLEEAIARELTVLITSHDLHQIERMADQIAILHGGRIIVAESLDGLKGRLKRIRVGTMPSTTFKAHLAGLPGVMEVEEEEGGYLLTVTADPQGLAAGLYSLPNVTGVQIIDLSLEEIFLFLCGGLRPDGQRGEREEETPVDI
ncbi:MAG: ABC transporter ATP-binding protein [Firmicutes bacterium]|nr:ABC transporter ATP-binding protein [Bacillota bacterium]